MTRGREKIVVKGTNVRLTRDQALILAREIISRENNIGWDSVTLVPHDENSNSESPPKVIFVTRNDEVELKKVGLK